VTSSTDAPVTLTAVPGTERTTGHPPVAAPENLQRLARRVTVTGPGRDVTTSYAPFTGAALGTVPLCTADDVAEAFRRSREAQKAWAARSMRSRAAVFLRYHDRVLQRQHELLDLIQIENGKARKHAFEEVADVAITSRYYAHTASSHLASKRRQGALPVLTSAVEHHHPRGVIGIIAPWNYPLSLSITDAIPALLAGNGVVIKPDSQTVFTALYGVELLVEAGLPEGLFQVVTGPGSEIGTPLINEADYVCFTGSTATGRIVARQAGERLIGCSLELGGKNAMLVLHDADLDKTVDGAIRACYSSAGQLCISIERMLVHESIRPEFLRRFADRVSRMRLSPAFDYSADMGSLISASQLNTVTTHVDDAVAKGATVLAGGRARPDLGPYFYEPTVLDNVSPQMTLCAEETFGPVVSVYSFRDEDEAIDRANASSYGLNSSVWTRDARRGRRIGARIEAGTVNVNEAYGAAWASVDAPMGGFKDSGLGRRHGREGILKYTEAQTVATQRFLGFDAPFGMGNEAYAKFLTASLKLMRRNPFVK
jgi:succinate-semialdehyde dehydrogenase/glutarate-semialdehyde dehydrogenase